MTQTAVSYQIKLLEEHVGEPLFLRRPRQVLLTAVVAASRNRPRGPMPPLELHSEGTWSVAGREKAVVEQVQRLLAVSPRSCCPPIQAVGV